ncbi:M24 family metallopeptidase [Bhargavaea beijingensis]|uniref:Aminopeptidase P family protein n=2 Tax=Bhargavaea beijingensis TaxID=426756 RepID=A0ABX9ZAK3_9BACL|nr:Xaa-Pro peptidase family protein [Bhargavaea beijingensis]MCW1928518.1 Xaa-Pro peptidase family protein [Bhargavaea beijingensis]RSK25374.1 aminopeptidase P family protein [Bhargavaea beijingensis]
MKKLKEIRMHLEENGIDLALVTTPDNVFYLSGFKSEPHERLLAVAVFRDAEPFIIAPKMEVPDVKAAGWTGESVGHEDTDDAWLIVEQAIRNRGITPSRIAIEKSHLNVERFERVKELYPEASFTGLDSKLNAMRNIKDETELEKLRKAAELADYAIGVGCREIAEGKTELEILTAIEFEMKKKGVSHMSFDTMVLSGKKTASPHGTPGDRKIRKGDFILFDLGVVWEGYCSDITRTVAFGEPTEEMRNIYETVKRAEQAAVDAVKPGVRAMDLDKVSRDVITEAGYGEYFTHRLGHGLGISVHEFPSLHGSNEMELQEGMVFTIEPGIYHPDITGVRIEDDVVVTANGVEVLTKFPKELQIIS